MPHPYSEVGRPASPVHPELGDSQGETESESGLWSLRQSSQRQEAMARIGTIKPKSRGWDTPPTPPTSPSPSLSSLLECPISGLHLPDGRTEGSGERGQPRKRGTKAPRHGCSGVCGEASRSGQVVLLRGSWPPGPSLPHSAPGDSFSIRCDP